MNTITRKALLRGVSATTLAAAAFSLASPAAAQAAVSPDRYDTQAEVNSWYKTQYAPALSTPIGWTGNTNHCAPGSYSEAALQTQQAQLNALRDYSGLERVVLKKDSAVQKTALMMDASSMLSHHPLASGFKCWSKDGAAKAGVSNLAFAMPMTAGSAIDQYLEEQGSGNYAAGHRRWLMNPKATEFRIGQTGRANALQVISVPNRTGQSGRKALPWPKDGYFPNQLDTDRWSLSLNDPTVSWRNPRVVVLKDGKLVKGIKVQPLMNGMAAPTVVWDMPKEAGPRVGNYRVYVMGAMKNNRPRGFYSYTVKMFTAK